MDNDTDLLRNRRLHEAAARVLGMGRASVLRYVNGEQEVPVIVERTIAEHGAPEEWR